MDQSLTVLDTMWKAYPRLYETPLRTALGAMGLTGEDAHRLVGQLSGGERARLKLAIICLADSNVLVLDEPTNHLDLPSKEVLQQALAEYEGTLIIVSHDRYLLDCVPNRIFAIEQGALHQYKGGYGAYLRAKAELGPERAAAPQPKTESEQKNSITAAKSSVGRTPAAVRNTPKPKRSSIRWRRNWNKSRRKWRGTVCRMTTSACRSSVPS